MKQTQNTLACSLARGEVAEYSLDGGKAAVYSHSGKSGEAAACSLA